MELNLDENSKKLSKRLLVYLDSLIKEDDVQNKEQLQNQFITFLVSSIYANADWNKAYLNKKLNEAYNKFFKKYESYSEIKEKYKYQIGKESLQDRLQNISGVSPSQIEALKRKTNKLFYQNKDLQSIRADLQKTFGRDFSDRITNITRDRLMYERRKVNNFTAAQFDLKHFLYDGTIIDTSRCFCKDKVSKYFSLEEAKKWELTIGQECGVIWNKSKDGIYIPTEHMGGIGCHHEPAYVSKKIYDRFK